MSKVMMYVADAALIAGAIAITVATGGGGMYAIAGAIQLTAAQTAAMAGAMIAMGAGQMLTSIGQAIAGGGVSASQSAKNSVGSRQTVYGQTRVSGTVIYMSTTDGVIKQNVINQVFAWASHPCQSVDYIYIDGKEVFFEGASQGRAGAEGYADGNTHYDQSGNAYSFGGSNRYLACYSTLGSLAGHWISQLGSGVTPPHGDYNFRGDSNWSSACTLNGICATAVMAASNASVFTNIPQAKAAIKGKCDIYDPRLGPINADGSKNAAYCSWTANAALIIADFLTNSDYGMGFLWSEIDLTQLIAAANTCDEQVPLATGKLGSWIAGYAFTIGQQILDSNGRQQTCTGTSYGSSLGKSAGSHPVWSTTLGGNTTDGDLTWTAGAMGTGSTESRYTINGIVDWAATPGDTLAQMLEACAGRISMWNGQVKIYPGAYYGTSGVSYGLTDIVDKVSFRQKKYRDICNQVRAKFICPSYPYSIVGYDKNHKDNSVFDGQFQPTDAPSYAQDAGHGYASDANLAADGGIPLIQDRSYNFVQSVGQCQRLMKIYMLRSRQKWSGTIRVNAKGLQNVPNDVIPLTIPQYNWTNKLFEISEVRHIPVIEDGKPPVIVWEFDLQETDPSIYTWSVAEERGVTNTASPRLNDNLQVAPITGLTLTSSLATSLVGPDGTVTPQILASWTQPNDPFTLSGGSIVVQIELVGTSVWNQVAICSGTTTQLPIGGVIAGLSYNVQVMATHAGGASSGWVLAGPFTVPASLTSTPAGTNELVVNGNFTQGMASWSSNTANASVSNAQSKGGAQSLLLNGSTGQAYCQQGMSGLLANHTYLLQCWVMTAGNVVAANCSGVGINAYPSTGTITVISNTAAGSAAGVSSANLYTYLAATSATAWTLIQLIVEPSANCSLTILPETVGTGSCPSLAWIDGVSVTDVSAIIAPSIVAQQALAVISSDGWLSKGEKSQVKLDWQNIVGEEPGIAAIAASVGLSSTSYVTAYNTLSAYLALAYSAGGVGTGGTDWSNTSTDSQISAAAWTSNWNAYYNAKEALLNAISGVNMSLASAANLVVNGNFEAGNTGWGTGGVVTSANTGLH